MRKFNVLFLLILIFEILTFGGCSKTKKIEKEFSEQNSDLNSDLKSEDKKIAKRISNLEKEIAKAEKKENSIKNIKIAGTKNFSSIPLAFMMESNKSLSKKVLLDYEIFSSEDELETNFLENKIDFAVLSLNSAGKIYNEFENIKILAVLQNESSQIQEETELSDEYSTIYAIVVNSDFAKENKKITKKVLNLFENAQIWVSKNPIKASIFAERKNLLPSYNQKNISELIENSNFTFFRKKCHSEFSSESVSKEILN